MPADGSVSPLRASDAERDMVMSQLGEHAAHGRLTLAELEERIERAYTAQTVAELQTLTGDLPVATANLSRRKPTRRLLALMSGHEQRGSRKLPRPGAPLVRVRVFACMGGVDVWRVPAEMDGVSLKEAKKKAKQLER